MAARAHDLAVPHAAVVVLEESLELDRWKCWSEREGATVHHYAAGPCPGCGAQVQGHLADAPAPLESLGGEDEPQPSTPVVEIPVWCTCGASHGQEGAHGCGRRWSISAPAATHDPQLAMTPSRPVGAGAPDPLDLDAAERLALNEEARLPLVRARAEKWIGGVTALGGVLGSVLVVKGRDAVTQIDLAWRIAAALALMGALVLLAYGTYCAYRAAFGPAGGLEEVSPDPLSGLHHRLLQGRRNAATAALKELSTAITSVFIAIGLIATGVGITWFAPTAPSPSTKSTCISSNGQVLLQLSGDSAAVKQLAPGVTVGPCR